MYNLIKAACMLRLAPARSGMNPVLLVLVTKRRFKHLVVISGIKIRVWNKRKKVCNF